MQKIYVKQPNKKYSNKRGSKYQLLVFWGVSFLFFLCLAGVRYVWEFDRTVVYLPKSTFCTKQNKINNISETWIK